MRLFDDRPPDVAANVDVYSFGFSTRTWQETIELLKKFQIQCVADIRTLPRSRHTPQFNQEDLAKSLLTANIEYVHLKALGGLRKPIGNNRTNAAWKNEGFRAYADYMQTPQFESALEELIGILSAKTTAFACTEAVFWRCHRRLVSDALTVRGRRVGEIYSSSKVEEHRLTKFLKVEGTRVTYPGLV